MKLYDFLVNLPDKIRNRRQLSQHLESHAQHGSDNDCQICQENLVSPAIHFPMPTSSSARVLNATQDLGAGMEELERELLEIRGAYLVRGCLGRSEKCICGKGCLDDETDEEMFWGSESDWSLWPGSDSDEDSEDKLWVLLELLRDATNEDGIEWVLEMTREYFEWDDEEKEDEEEEWEDEDMGVEVDNQNGLGTVEVGRMDWYFHYGDGGVPLDEDRDDGLLG
ncbi:uncharacterized protein DFL_004421 [Arthrobotrys flagrans]|uniref:Uncharacterized protein n=1 Tax=Arthrobotrys flagrans TaxID=97331 RepID=A0A437A554_ARTFL|nr:hypothetical protein DFL_004421 [Arthrobotrys flagrans]